MIRKPLPLTIRAVAAAAGFGLCAYGVLAAAAWIRYGRCGASKADEPDELLDRFMPAYDVVERHQIEVAAPAATALEAAKEQDLRDSLVVRAIFKTREAVLRASPSQGEQPRGLLAQVQSLGWGVLADVPGREIVMGAVTKPELVAE